MNEKIKAINKGLMEWTPGIQLMKAVKECNEGCCGRENCMRMVTGQELPDKCMYEVWAGYKFIKAVLEIKDEWVIVSGKKGWRWNSAWNKLSEYQKITAMDMAINRMHVIRCDVEINGKGVSVVETTRFYDAKTGELTREVDKLVPNPAIQAKNSLAKLNKELGQTIILSEKDKDEKKVKEPTDGLSGPLAGFMQALGKAKLPSQETAKVN